ncbi:MAG: SPFH domain-containing protein [Oscillospiraceae bacterium]|jgi:membrane protease subunit (stomatin/prohibitin family)|nr:SPFH domain-containing protein [Oscillospiraceae bacterium]
MGLIKAALGSVGGVLADQWLEFFYCESLPENVMAVKGQKRITGRSSNTKGEENIISNGSGIAVADGQCMIIVEQGKILDFCAEPGQYTFDQGGEPSLFAGGGLGHNALASLKSVFDRFKHGGSPGMDTRVYYFNTKELIGNKYGTPSPVPFRVVDQNIGLDIDIAIRCFGEYSYRITNPMLFYANVCGNVREGYKRETIEGQLKTELMTALQPAFAKISAMGIRYSMLPGHTMELAEALNEVLSAKWRDLRGLEIVSFGVSSVKASDEDEKMIKELQRNATFRNPTMAAAHLVSAQATAMQSAAANENAGPAMAFMGMNMAGNAGGMNAQNLFAMGQQQAQQPQQQQYAPMSQQQSPAPAAPTGWTCPCGHTANIGKFCAECGKPQPQAAGWSCPCGHTDNIGKFCAECGKPQPQATGWTCSCGAVNTGKFCSECASPKPAGVPQYKCDKCGWIPPDPTKPPKFCPECADPFDDGDVV